MGGTMRFTLLGALSVEDENGPIELRGGMPRTVLASLLMHANAVVTTDALIDALWQGRPPPTATAALYNHVMRLRRALGDAAGERIRAIPPGYAIRIEPGELDLDVFADLCADGRAAAREADWDRAAERFRAALALWPKSPRDWMPAEPGGEDARVRQLTEERWQAWEQLIEAELRSGRHREVLGDLRALTREHPLRESFHGQLMLALYRSHQQAEALEAFRQLRRTLVDDLGVEPCAAIRGLQQRILNADPELAAPVPAPIGNAAEPDPAAPQAPCRLPANTRAFEGRSGEISRLTALATQGLEEAEAGVVTISAIDGMGGIGKTALAVHVAHRLRERFPDGQLFVNLHGHTPGVRPLTSAEALDTLLRALGVPAQAVPSDVDGRAALYRERMADTRRLIVLDDAAGTAQVRPLLPGTAGSLVIVTSRRRLTSLDDAYPVSLDVLPDEDAAALLHKVAGPGRIAAQDPGIPELLALCGHLPLAVRITASRLCHRRALRVEDVVAQLRDERTRLERLEDENRGLTAVFELSYRQLSEAEQLVFRRLSLVPGPDFDAYAAAQLIESDHATAERHLESLLDHNLLIQHDSGRYRFHDLVSLYARKVGEQDDPPALRRAAMNRLLDYFEHTAWMADRYLARHPRCLPPSPVPAPAVVPPLPHEPAANLWLRAETANLLGAIGWTATTPDQLPRSVSLTSAVATVLKITFRHEQANPLHQSAATASRVIGDRYAEANALFDFGDTQFNTGGFRAAQELFERALALYDELGHRLGQANATWQLSQTSHMTGQFPAALEQARAALAIYRELGERLGQANVRFHMGRVYVNLGEPKIAADLFASALADFQALDQQSGTANALWCLGKLRAATGEVAEARDYFIRAAAIYHAIGSMSGEAWILFELGSIHAAEGEHRAAIDAYEQALPKFRQCGHRSGQANTLHVLGKAKHASGDATAADLLEQALAIFRQIGDPQGEAEVLNSTAALVAEGEDGADEALPLYGEAFRLAREISSPVDEAHALEGRARCLAALGRHEAAVTDLGAALAIYERLALPEADAAATLMARFLTGSGTHE